MSQIFSLDNKKLTLSMEMLRLSLDDGGLDETGLSGYLIRRVQTTAAKA